MLVQDQYAMKSMQDVRRLIREHRWALLVVGGSGGLRAAHVPCLLDPVHDAGGAGEQLVIIGHTARADPVVSELRSGQQVLLVFQGPNGYVSPAWYGEGPSPPTWNFTAVHVSGIPGGPRVHVGCDTTQCGACTVHLDGHAVKPCTVLAVQADGATVDTFQSLSKAGEVAHRCWRRLASITRGFCTPGHDPEHDGSAAA